MQHGSADTLVSYHKISLASLLKIKWLIFCHDYKVLNLGIIFSIPGYHDKIQVILHWENDARIAISGHLQPELENGSEKPRLFRFLKTFKDLTIPILGFFICCEIYYIFYLYFNSNFWVTTSITSLCHSLIRGCITFFLGRNFVYRVHWSVKKQNLKSRKPKHFLLKT